MFSSTIQRRASTREVSRQTRSHHNAPTLTSRGLLLAHVMDRQLQRIVRSRKIDIVHPVIRLFQLSLIVQIILEELVLVLSNPCVDEDIVDGPEPLEARFESFTLATPVGDVALQS